MKSAPPIVFLRHWGSYFKSARHAEAFAREFRPLIARGWVCRLVLDRAPEDPRWLHELERMGVRIDYARRPRSHFDLGAVIQIYRHCRQTGASILVCENMHTAPLLGAALARVPVRIWIKRSMCAHFEEARPPTFKERLALTTKLSCRLATRVFAVSKSVKDELLGLGIPEERVWVRHNARRLGATAAASDREAVRRQYGLADSDVVMTSVGHAVPVKGWDLLIRAFGRVANCDPRARLVLVGSVASSKEAPVYAELKSWLDGHSLGGRVVFTGHLANIAPILKASDVFVMSSRSEGFSLALVEALEAGLPCVATRVGIAEDVIREGVNGLLVERCDETALASALQRLMSDEMLLRELTRNAVVPACIPTMEEHAAKGAADYEELLTL